LDKNYAIQGELCGPKIQNNPMGLTENKFFVFNIIDLNTRERINIKEQMAFCDRHGLDHVPIVELGDCFDYTLEALLPRVAQHKYPNTKKPIEGYVIRPQCHEWNEKLEEPLSCKLMNP